jgi:hypothetical protein
MGSESLQPRSLAEQVVRDGSPLFVLEGQSTPLNFNAPAAVTTTPTPSAPEGDAETPEQSRFIQELQDIEAAAKAEMAAWDPMYLPQSFDPACSTAQVPAKRKGMLDMEA